MFGIIPINIPNILISFVVAVIVVILGIVVFDWIWISRLTFVFPRGNYRILDDSSEFIRTDSLREYVYVMWTLLSKLDVVYWLDNVGLEGKEILFQSLIISNEFALLVGVLHGG